MTNESKRHERELADVGERLSRRASVYHALLVRWVDIKLWINFERTIAHPDGYFFCGYCIGYGPDEDTINHEHGCIVGDTLRALDGDDDALREMMRELGG